MHQPRLFSPKKGMQTCLRYVSIIFSFVLMFMLSQCDTPRSATETLIELKQQVRCACKGVKKHVELLQTQSGVKCPLTQAFIVMLLDWFKELKASGSTAAEAEATLLDWVAENDDSLYNPLLSVQGLSLPLSFLNLYLTLMQVLILPKPLQWSSCTPSCLASSDMHGS
jgi:hypothetical protein